MLKFKQYNRDGEPGSKFQGIMNSGRTNPVCKRCGNNHKGEYIASIDAYFEYGNIGNNIKKAPIVDQQGMNNYQRSQDSPLSSQ